MGREVRMVPANWEHPKDEHGDYEPLLGGDYESAAAEWDAEHTQWQLGLARNYGEGPSHVPIEEAYRSGTYTAYSGRRPSPDDYMPHWPGAERTHFMMYEDTTEGTPISPAFATPEELARWLTDNEASAFGRMTGSYEGWLRVAQGGFAPSLVLHVDGTRRGMTSGVDGLE